MTCNTCFAFENLEMGNGWGIWGRGTCNSFLSLMKLRIWWLGDWEMQLLTSLVWNLGCTGMGQGRHWPRDNVRQHSQVPPPTCCWKWYPQACQLGEHDCPSALFFIDLKLFSKVDILNWFWIKLSLWWNIQNWNWNFHWRRDSFSKVTATQSFATQSKLSFICTQYLMIFDLWSILNCF